VGQVGNTHAGAFSQTHYALVQCRDCDVVRLDPLPTDDDLDVLYRQTEQFDDDLYTDAERIESMLDYYGHCLDHLGLMPRDGEASLEVGAGFAWVSRAIRQRSDAVRTIAQDVTEECVGRTDWVDDYHVGQVDELPGTRRFRLISLTHVIEHLKHPARMLLDLSERLLPGGRILITAPHRPEGWTPDAGLETWLSYSYLHVPAHIAYLSKTWFEITAARCGLRLIHWDASHENGQAFEAVLELDPGRGQGWWARRRRRRAFR
jgi:2-polyprenyl-3-methyl-5-hydroxy-6-metoxy-1,4-benzoquinol methylase